MKNLHQTRLISIRISNVSGRIPVHIPHNAIMNAIRRLQCPIEPAAAGGNRRVCGPRHAWTEVEHEGAALSRTEQARALERDGVDGRGVVSRGVHAPAVARAADVPESVDAMQIGRAHV